jgi:hypothetical protein
VPAIVSTPAVSVADRSLRSSREWILSYMNTSKTWGEIRIAARSVNRH